MRLSNFNHSLLQITLAVVLALTVFSAEAARPKPPGISSINPSSGPVGTSVTINGNNLSTTTSVRLNSISQPFTLVGGGKVRFTVTAGATSGIVSVTNPDGTANGPVFTVVSPPVISSFSPSTGSAGTLVSVSGSNFSGTTTVQLNGTNCAYAVVNASQITFTVPAGATTGLITVVNAAGVANSSSAFTVTFPPPTISSFAPSSGTPGTSVTVSGTNFTGVTAVRLNGMTCAYTVVSSTQISLTVPSGSTSGFISVTASGGTVTSAAVFTVIVPAPTISSFSPSSGWPGVSVTVTGNDFSGASAVTLNGSAVAFTVFSATQISFVVPSGASSGPIGVTTSGGTGVSSSSFTVTLPPAPVITSFTPTSGPVGSSVTVAGSNFFGATAVQLNGTAVSFTVVSSSEISFVVPANATSGAISITTSGGTGTSTSVFTVTTPPAPVITSFTPTSGPVGAIITVNGSNFTDATAVRLNGLLSSFNVLSSTQLTFTVPTGATSGLVSVTGPAGTGSSSATFTVSAATLPIITRGAYMVGPSESSVNIQWRTNVACNTEVRYGTSPTALTQVVSDAATVTDHTVRLSNLQQNTLYYYSIGIIGVTIQSGMENCFRTAKGATTMDSIRFWITGDFGNNSTNQRNTLTAFLNYTASSTVHGWLWLGDNAYSYGTDSEYQTKVFDVYGNLFRRLPVYPAPGNHDYASSGYQSSASLGTNFPYFSIFAIPTNSGTEKYYSYDYGNIHFIALDSYGSYNAAGSPMYNWLQNDLATNTRLWTVVYFHHPPYSMGSHNSDTETELIDMRNNIIPLLEQNGVDLVLSGHSHSYERSMFIKGHYGLETTFNSADYPTGNVVQVSPDTYTKVNARDDGTIYVVCGVSGQSAGTVQTRYPHNAMQVSSNANNGSLVLDVVGNELTCQFLTTTGAIFDSFSISKSGSFAKAGSTRIPDVVRYYDITGRYLGEDYSALPYGELIVVRSIRGNDVTFAKIIKTR